MPVAHRRPNTGNVSRSSFPPPPANRPRIQVPAVTDDEEPTMLMPYKAPTGSVHSVNPPAPPTGRVARLRPSQAPTGRVARVAPTPSTGPVAKLAVTQPAPTQPATGRLARPAPSAPPPAWEHPSQFPQPQQRFVRPNPFHAPPPPVHMAPPMAPPSAPAMAFHVDPPSTVIMARKSGRGTMAWAGVLLGAAVVVAVVGGLVGAGKANGLLRTTASFVDPSRASTTSAPMAATAVPTAPTTHTAMIEPKAEPVAAEPAPAATAAAPTARTTEPAPTAPRRDVRTIASGPTLTVPSTATSTPVRVKATPSSGLTPAGVLKDVSEDEETKEARRILAEARGEKSL